MQQTGACLGDAGTGARDHRGDVQGGVDLRIDLTGDRGSLDAEGVGPWSDGEEAATDDRKRRCIAAGDGDGRRRRQCEDAAGRIRDRGSGGATVVVERDAGQSVVQASAARERQRGTAVQGDRVRRSDLAVVGEHRDGGIGDGESASGKNGAAADQIERALIHHGATGVGVVGGEVQHTRT